MHRYFSSIVTTAWMSFVLQLGLGNMLSVTCWWRYMYRERRAAVLQLCVCDTQHPTFHQSVLSSFASLLFCRGDYGSIALWYMYIRVFSTDCQRPQHSSEISIQRSCNRISSLLCDLRWIGVPQRIRPIHFVWTFLCSTAATRQGMHTWQVTYNGRLRAAVNALTVSVVL